jgi:hypothetical protein
MMELATPPENTALTRLLFPLPALRRSAFDIVLWWESRRMIFNTVVGATGLVTLASMFVVERLAHLPLILPWQVVVLYGICANVAYSAGAALEVLSVKLWKEEIAPVGPTLFRYGLVFSVGLTLFPIALGGLGAVLSVLKSFF